MAKFNQLELDLLQEAFNAYPEGINSPDDFESEDYKAFVRLYDAGLIDSNIEPTRLGRQGALYRNCKITESGRDVLDQVRETLGDVTSEDEPMLIGLAEARSILIQHIHNLQKRGNELGIHITVEEVTRAEKEINDSKPGMIRKVVD